ncbi:HSP20-like chaperone [Hepatocystis sp. ex Piliocolobus tephrosceles]|nr:HSP20-like chaperone [Hepatocystis sp. ex Piliocolobus tephrosceles]
MLKSNNETKTTSESMDIPVFKSNISSSTSLPVESEKNKNYYTKTHVIDTYTTFLNNDCNVRTYIPSIKTYDNTIYSNSVHTPPSLYYNSVEIKTHTNNVFEVLPPIEELNNITYSPEMEIYSTSQFLIIMMNLPGLSKKNLHVELENKLLKIYGQKKKTKIEELEKKNEYYTKINNRKNAYYFCKHFQIPAVFCESSNISCTLNDGELVFKILVDEVKVEKKVINVH